MTYGIYAIYDVAMQCYAQPFYQANDEVAKRSFKMAINHPQAENLYSVREDLELWKIGNFNDKTGSIEYRNENETLLHTYNQTSYPMRIVSRGEAVIHEIGKETSTENET